MVWMEQECDRLMLYLGAIRIVYPSQITSVNDIDYSCCSTLNCPNVPGLPAVGWGCFVCIKSDNYKLQIFTLASSSQTFLRIGTDNWKNWKELVFR